MGKAGCAPNTVLVALVIAGIVMVILAGIMGEQPLVNPAIDSSGDSKARSARISPREPPAKGASHPPPAVDAPDTDQTKPCWDGCLLDRQCGGGPSIVARYNPLTKTRYYYLPGHPTYSAFRSAETYGETNYYFCDPVRAEAKGWQRAPGD